LLGCVIVLAVSAGASALVVLNEIHTLRDALNQNPSLNLTKGTLVTAGYGAPETFLLVGNDQRKHTTTTPVLPHSNEMLLVRFDPSKPWISMMSIPRELQVTIQCPNGPATTRLNYALTCGGISLLASTIKQLTGVPINHVIVIDFNHFKTAVNEMGCVYSTVDRRYYHINLPYGEQYQEINLQPGYQKMCGDQALQFVSYRHGDTSLVRDARDQSFLLDVKKEYGPTLVDNVHRFEQIFGQTVQTDAGLKSTTGILNLLGTLISGSSLRVRQVQFNADLSPPPPNLCNCVTATPQMISASVSSFLHGGGAPPTRRTAAAARAVHRSHGAARLPLVPTAPTEIQQAQALAPNLPFPVEFPRVQDRGGSVIPVTLRNYLIHGPEGTPYPAYVAVFSAGQLGQYYDVQGMPWTTAPLFDSPDQTVQVGRREYYLYYEGQHLQVVAWYEHGAVYWIRNSLVDAVGNGEMLAIAEQTDPVGSPGGAVQPSKRVTLGAAVVPTRASAQLKTPVSQTLGSLGGLLTLLAVPLLAIPLFKRWRDLQTVRGELRTNLEREAQLSAGVAALACGRRFQPPVAAAAGGVAGRQVGATIGVPAREAPAPINVYSGSRMRMPTPLLVVVTIAIVGGAALLGVLVNVEGGRAISTIQRKHNRAKEPIIKASVTIPVTVLNAGSIPGAAHRLALQLRARGVKIGAVGNLSGASPPATEILYGSASGDRAQATRLAALLPANNATIAPIDPVTQAAAGNGAQLVVVLP
jgi:LCP family protein required for cell wall assembly